MFETLIQDAQHFVKKLAKNNARDWFQDHKSEYETKLRDPAKDLLAQMEPRLAELTGFPIKGKLFRIHRDVRFSKDKTPYQTHLHMMWTVQSGTRQDPVAFFGIDIDSVTVGTGMMEFQKEVLEDWRKMADLDGAFLSAKIKQATDHGYRLWEPKLKRVPPSFDKEHAYANLLRHKGLIVTGAPKLTGDLITDLGTAYETIWPVADMLIGVAEAPAL